MASFAKDYELWPYFMIIKTISPAIVRNGANMSIKITQIISKLKSKMINCVVSKIISRKHETKSRNAKYWNFNILWRTKSPINSVEAFGSIEIDLFSNVIGHCARHFAARAIECLNVSWCKHELSRTCAHRFVYESDKAMPDIRRLCACIMYMHAARTSYKNSQPKFCLLFSIRRTTDTAIRLTDRIISPSAAAAASSFQHRNTQTISVGDAAAHIAANNNRPNIGIDYWGIHRVRSHTRNDK